MNALMMQRVRLGTVLGGLAVLSACGPKEAPKVAPPPPRPAIVVPPRPTPPIGASNHMVIPPVGPDGVRQTVNANLTELQRTWNFRSAYNVAALNCQKPQHASIVVGYRAFIRKHARGLTTANRGVDTDFRAKYGARFIAPRETYMTQVYNYFAYPPTLDAFCDAAQAMSTSAQAVATKDLNTFAAAELPRIEQVFENFFRAYDQYRLDAAAWDAKYAPVMAAVPAQAAQPAIVSPTNR